MVLAVVDGMVVAVYFDDDLSIMVVVAVDDLLMVRLLLLLILLNIVNCEHLVNANVKYQNIKNLFIFIFVNPPLRGRSFINRVKTFISGGVKLSEEPLNRLYAF